MMALSIWLGVARFLMTRIESSWPLIYYAVLILYWKTFEGMMNGYWVLAGVTCGLLMRFEFLAKPVYRVVRVAEATVLAYVLVRSVQMMAQYR